MFSANENLMLRQYKRRIVQEIEATMPDEALDLGTTVMVMQVSCKAVGCVPLETAIIIIFPNSETELVPGLPESRNGGSYKTKVLKPMADVTNEDILEALPPAFKGGQRTMENLCLYARDVMLAQITQLFGEDGSVSDRSAMAEYLQQCLKDYIANDCKAPERGEPFTAPDQSVEDSETTNDQTLGVNESTNASTSSITPSTLFPAKGNIVIRRVVEEPSKPSIEDKMNSARGQTGGGVLSERGPTKHSRAIQKALTTSTSSSISKLFEREHVPGIRQPGCPCCDPGNPSNLVDMMMML